MQDMQDIVQQAQTIIDCPQADSCPIGLSEDQKQACPFDGARGGDCPLESLPDDEILYDLADLFKIFADTTRIKILYALFSKSYCVAEIADIVGAKPSAVSHQLRILKQAHLVKFQRDGKNVIYSLADEHVYTILAQGLTHICE